MNLKDRNMRVFFLTWIIFLTGQLVFLLYSFNEGGVLINNKFIFNFMLFIFVRSHLNGDFFFFVDKNSNHSLLPHNLCTSGNSLDTPSDKKDMVIVV